MGRSPCSTGSRRPGSASWSRGGARLGYEHIGTTVRVLIHELHITIINTDTGEIIRDLTLDTSRDYQPLGRPPGPPKGSPQRGGRPRKITPEQTKSRDTR